MAVANLNLVANLAAILVVNLVVILVVVTSIITNIINIANTINVKNIVVNAIQYNKLAAVQFNKIAVAIKITVLHSLTGSAVNFIS